MAVPYLKELAGEAEKVFYQQRKISDKRRDTILADILDATKAVKKSYVKGNYK